MVRQNAKSSSREYVILCRQDNIVIPDGEGKKYYVSRRNMYNQHCIILWCKDTPCNDDTYGMVYEYANGLYKYRDALYAEASDVGYELVEALRGNHIHKEDVSNFINKVKSIKDEPIGHDRALKNGYTNTDYFSSGGGV